jgi:hypothetical protein
MGIWFVSMGKNTLKKEVGGGLESKWTRCALQPKKVDHKIIALRLSSTPRLDQVNITSFMLLTPSVWTFNINYSHSILLVEIINN